VYSFLVDLCDLLLDFASAICNRELIAECTSASAFLSQLEQHSSTMDLTIKYELDEEKHHFEAQNRQLSAQSQQS
jgi:hypothetical protein